MISTNNKIIEEQIIYNNVDNNQNISVDNKKKSTNFFFNTENLIKNETKNINKYTNGRSGSALSGRAERMGGSPQLRFRTAGACPASGVCPRTAVRRLGIIQWRLPLPPARHPWLPRSPASVSEIHRLCSCLSALCEIA